ncbi:MAG: SDR family oxidoreductase [Rhizobiaceae bacterium]|nr:SDR family oxidoreductase [Rhizobiaceae bacterium]MCV0406957.1 SDR family oxidoreductase [Rhizobiaceae bacterium]
MTRILVTGAAGLVGQALLDLAGEAGHDIIAGDIRRPARLPEGAEYRPLDVRGADPDTVIGEAKPEAVVHLASIVTPPKGSTREAEYAVDVTGTENVLEACIRHGVKRLVVTSSGAAYGYHADNPVPLKETDALRGNDEFAYARHKRLVEEMLARARADHPGLEQVVLRVGTVLGPGLDNQITALFRRPRLLAVAGADSPFVFIWVDDLGRILLAAATGDGPAGIYNVAGDGALSVHDIAARLGKPVLNVPAWMLKAALAVARPLGLTRYGPEQVRFLQYRPVLDNSRLKSAFGYTPELTSAEAFEAWRRSVEP